MSAYVVTLEVVTMKERFQVAVDVVAQNAMSARNAAISKYRHAVVAHVVALEEVR